MLLDHPGECRLALGQRLGSGFDAALASDHQAMLAA
jgi:hypothetical protein